MQRKVDALEARAEALQAEIARLEEVRRSVKAEIVRYEAPGTALVPVRVRRCAARALRQHPQRRAGRGSARR